jgi:hypothetical protein
LDFSSAGFLLLAEHPFVLFRETVPSLVAMLSVFLGRLALRFASVRQLILPSHRPDVSLTQSPEACRDLRLSDASSVLPQAAAWVARLVRAKVERLLMRFRQALVAQMSVSAL